MSTEAKTAAPKSWPRMAAGALVVVAGLVLISSTFINNLFEVGPAFEEMIDDFRPMLTDEALDTAKADIGGLAAVADEFQNAVIPGMSQQLVMDAAQFGGFLGESFPAVAQGAAALPEIATTFNSLIGTLEAEQGRFASADAIPTESLPATTVPWGMLGAGVVAVLIGLFMFVRPRLGSMLALVLGVALVAVPAFLSLPQKAADADQLNENLEPVYTAELVAGAQGALGVVGAMGMELQTAMLPALAQQLEMQPDQLSAFIGENFPAMAGVMANMDTTMGRFQGMVTAFDVNLDNYDTLKPVKFVPIIWTMILVGIGIVLFGAWGFLASSEG
ncbi:MAG: hypothetical protein P1T08_05000 [Acidimicrobiia bacterium]|nr:hypothetical protein [Acidimicrobiia bacterium]